MTVESSRAGSRVPRRRPARSYRDFLQQILLLASEPTTTRAFIADVVRLLAAFTAADVVEIWVQRGHRRFVGYSYDNARDQLEPLGSVESASGLDGERPPVAPPEYLSRVDLSLRFGAEVGGWIHLFSREAEFFHAAKRELYRDAALTLGAAVAYQRAQSAQRERVKELSCLYQIARFSAELDQPVDEVMQRVVEILPLAWLHADVAAARILLDGQTFVTPGFARVLTELSAPVMIRGRARGSVTVGYYESRAEVDDGPFLDEERSLLDAVAREVAQIWEERQAAADRRRLQDQLRHADRLATIGQLAAGVAHELNEPLGSILGFAQLALKTPALPVQVGRDLERIASAALHSREVVRKLNLFARQAPARRERLQLSQVVEEGLFLLESRCAKEGIELVLEMDPTLPHIVGDSGQITQVVMNLAVNAIQAMPEGGELRISTEGGGDVVLLTVSDTGAGIPPQVAARIFEPFFTTKDVGAGTGLGLSVVHGIVTAHGGRVQVQTAPGKGTAFCVHFPLERPDD